MFLKVRTKHDLLEFKSKYVFTVLFKGLYLIFVKLFMHPFRFVICKSSSFLITWIHNKLLFFLLDLCFPCWPCWYCFFSCSCKRILFRTRWSVLFFRSCLLLRCTRSSTWWNFSCWTSGTLCFTGSSS